MVARPGIFDKAIDLGFIGCLAGSEKFRERAGLGTLRDGQILLDQMLDVSLRRHAQPFGAFRYRGHLLLTEAFDMKF
jgi:hypothetical protein